MVIHFFYRNENKFYYYKENFKKVYSPNFITKILNKYLNIYRNNIKQRKTNSQTINTCIKLHPFFSYNNETITAHWLNRLKFQQTNVVLSKLEDIQQFMHESVPTAMCNKRSHRSIDSWPVSWVRFWKFVD